MGGGRRDQRAWPVDAQPPLHFGGRRRGREDRSGTQGRAVLAATLVNMVSRSACRCAGQVSPCCHCATPFWDTHIRNSPSGACAIPLSFPLQLVLSSLTPNIDNDRKYRG